MRHLLALAMLPAALSAQRAARTAADGSDAQRTQAVAITHVTVIDVARGVRLPDRTVVIVGSRIRTVRPSGETIAPVPPGARVVDGGGRFLIPGLWDMHVHDDTEAHTTDIYFPLLVANGVTGVRDMFSQTATGCATPELFPDLAALRQRVLAGELVGPRVVISSPILDGPHPMWPCSVAVHTADDARHAVETAARRGAAFMKIYDGLPRAAFFAVAAESRRVGLPFVGHVPRAVTAAEASDAGMRSIEHLTGLRPVCAEAKASDACRALARRFAANSTWHTPTLVVLRAPLTDSAAAASGADFTVGSLTDPRLAYVWPGQRQIWRDAHAQMLRLPVATLTRQAQAWAQDRAIVGVLREAGVRLLAGTDLGNPWVYPGFSLHDELSLLVDAGLTPSEALRAATLEPARFLRATDSLGTVAPGKLADLVLLDEDPLRDIRNTARICAVVVNGRLFTRADLDALLAGAKRAAETSSR